MIISSKKYLNVNRTRKAIFINNLIGGVAWGLGATIGVSIIIALASLIIKALNLVSVVTWFDQLSRFK